MREQEWQPAGVDIDTPSGSRIYDYALGGAHNFAADRAAAEAFFAAYPDAPLVARSNRAFLQRSVRYCAHQGIKQFLDLGSGIPTVGNVHEIAQRLVPAARVVYVDNEPVAVAHTREIIADLPYTAIVDADMRDAETVLGAPETRELIDFDQPLALMMVAVLHYVSDEDDITGILARYRSVLAPGSVLVVSHTTEDPRPEIEAVIQRVFKETGTPVIHRDRAEVAALLDGLELVEPGVVWTPQWRPDDDTDPLFAEPERSATFAAVGRVPSIL
ncbi:SAM-dependent methyltransferase [Phytohabitans rumicis]|uniref:SAM-dependent methyltransferase n=1 Tax=Phytohabitans rumicis TaxID=1076125 RepID=UPI001C4989C9